MHSPKNNYANRPKSVSGNGNVMITKGYSSRPMSSSGRNGYGFGLKRVSRQMAETIPYENIKTEMDYDDEEEEQG